MRETIQNYDDLPDEAQEYVMEAHRKFKEIAANPLPETKELDYAFFYDRVTGEFSDSKVKQDYFKTIATLPGRARHEGFHLAVIGRSSTDWIDGVLLFLQKVLVSRAAHLK
jgi:hypothetical protein